MTGVRALVLHGLGGTADSVGPITAGLRAAGVLVDAPTLPGHGETIDDLAAARWDDWTAAAARGFVTLAADGGPVVVIGQSLGAALALWLATSRLVPAGVAPAGVVCINPVVLPTDPDAVEHLEGMLARGRTLLPVGAPDIVDSTVTEKAFDALPITALLSFSAGVAALDYGRVRCPVLLVTSVHDQVVDPAQSDHLAAVLPAPPTRVRLEHSGHVAGLDLERAVVIDAILGWLPGRG